MTAELIIQAAPGAGVGLIVRDGRFRRELIGSPSDVLMRATRALSSARRTAAGEERFAASYSLHVWQRCDFGRGSLAFEGYAPEAANPGPHSMPRYFDPSDAGHVKLWLGFGAKRTRVRFSAEQAEELRLALGLATSTGQRFEQRFTVERAR